MAISHDPRPGSGPGPQGPAPEVPMLEEALQAVTTLRYVPTGILPAIQRLESLGRQSQSLEVTAAWEEDYKIKSAAAQLTENIHMVVRMAGKGDSRAYEDGIGRMNDIEAMSSAVLNRNLEGNTPWQDVERSLKLVPPHSSFQEIIADAARPHLSRLAEKERLAVVGGLSTHAATMLLRNFMESPDLDSRTLRLCFDLTTELGKRGAIDPRDVGVLAVKASGQLDGNLSRIGVLAAILAMSDLDSNAQAQIIAPALVRAYEKGAPDDVFVMTLERHRNSALTAMTCGVLTEIALYGQAEDSRKALDLMDTVGISSSHERTDAQSASVNDLQAALKKFRGRDDVRVEDDITGAFAVISRIGSGRSAPTWGDRPFACLTVNLIRIAELGHPEDSTAAWQTIVASARALDPRRLATFLDAKMQFGRDLVEVKYALATAKAMKAEAASLVDTVAGLAGIVKSDSGYAIDESKPIQPGMRDLVRDALSTIVGKGPLLELLL